LSLPPSDGEKTLATFIAENISRKGDASPRADGLKQQF
jgi:hemolysin D